MDPEEWRTPSRAELEREEHEELMRETYESRYAAFCRQYRLDPQDVGSALIYEQEWEEDEVERTRYDPS